METKPKIGMLSTFGGSDEAYSLIVVAKTQLQMLVEAGYNPILYVCPSFVGTGIWASNRVETRKTVPGDSDHVAICECLRKTIGDVDVMICHDIMFLSQHSEWAKAVRILAREFPHIKWLHWQHSRGDHSPIKEVPNSEFCYPNNGDLEHVAQINSTTLDKVHYIPHPLDFNYLGWNELAIRIAEDYQFPFVDVSMIYPTRLDRQKQVEKAIYVFAGLKKAGKSVCLLISDAYATGERFKDYKKDCLKIAKDVGLTDKEFAFLGEVYEECVLGTPRTTVKALFEMANLFLQVSTSETSSLVAMEAALAGNVLVLNGDFKPIHHLYGKAITMPFNSIFNNPPVQYFRHIHTADGQEMKVEDEPFFWEEQAKNTIIPVLNSQMTIALKKQQLRERWPSRAMKDYLEPLLLKDWKPDVPKCEGDPEVTAIITTLDNLPMLQKQINVMMKECGSIIVVNNGSKDGTKEWLETNPVIGTKLIHRDNIGAGPGRNAGLTLWDAQPTEYTLMLDGGIQPPIGGVKAMKSYLVRHPEVEVISPEIATCFTTAEEEATLVFNKEDIDDGNIFQQQCLSSTAYCLCRKSAWRVRFNEDGPYGEPGWGVDDNDMAFRWREENVLHQDFNQNEGMKLYRKASGSFQRLFEETGVWPTQYGSVYEKRVVKMYQDYPLYTLGMPEVSCVVLGWNEYPTIAKCVKRLHEEFKDIPHEIIVVNNGSTDETKKWMDEHALRQSHGDTTIGTNGEIIKKTPENEDTWTGNFIAIDLPENVGAGRGRNIGFEKARGQYIFYIDGDILPALGSVKALIQYLKDNDVDYACANANNSQGDNEDVQFTEYKEPGGLGHYAYAYAAIKREVWDAGCRFADQGPFNEAGCGYEETEFAYSMYSKGFKGCVLNGLEYYHKRRDRTRTGIDGNSDERKNYLATRWNKINYGVVYLHQPQERHLRRIALMNNNISIPGNIGPAGFLTMAFRNIGCEVDQYVSLAVPEKQYDNYIFQDDGDNLHWACPEWAHPSKYWTSDMFNPSGFPYSPPEEYLVKLRTFDEVFCSSKSATEYCIANGVQASHLPFAASEEYHRPYDSDRIYDWVAIWHNYGDRQDYLKAAQDRFPNGYFSDNAWGDEYPKITSQSLCVINRTRGLEYNSRVVESMMMGVPLVTDRTKYMDLFFVENEHYRGYSTIEEMLEQIQWVKDHPDAAEDMAMDANILVMKNHRYYHRALGMFYKEFIDACQSA